MAEGAPAPLTQTADDAHLETTMEPALPPAAAPAAPAAETPVCCKCGLPLQQGETGVRKSRHTLRCMRCNAAVSQLQRHLGGMPDGWLEMTEPKRMVFFQQVKASAEGTGGLVYEKLRSLLVDTLTETSKKVETTSKGGTFQPLSWWAQAGYDVEAVQEHGEREEHEARLAYQSRYLSRHVVRLQMFPSFSSLLRCSGKSSGWS